MNENKTTKRIQNFLEGYKVTYNGEEKTFKEVEALLEIELNLAHLAEELTKLGLND